MREFLQESGLCIWFARAAIRKYHRLEGLYNRNLFLTVLEGRSQNQGVSKDGSFSGLLGKICSRPFSLAC